MNNKIFELVTVEMLEAVEGHRPLKNRVEKLNELILGNAYIGTTMKGGKPMYDLCICGNIHREFQKGDDHQALVILKPLENIEIPCEHRFYKSEHYWHCPDCESTHFGSSNNSETLNCHGGRCTFKITRKEYEEKYRSKTKNKFCSDCGIDLKGLSE